MFASYTRLANGSSCASRACTPSAVTRFPPALSPAIAMRERSPPKRSAFALTHKSAFARVLERLGERVPQALSVVDVEDEIPAPRDRERHHAVRVFRERCERAAVHVHDDGQRPRRARRDVDVERVVIAARGPVRHVRLEEDVMPFGLRVRQRVTEPREPVCARDRWRSRRIAPRESRRRWDRERRIRGKFRS